MRVLFMGTGEIGLPVLDALIRSAHDVAAVITQPDRPAGRKLEPRASPVKKFAQQHALQVLQPMRIRDRSAIDEIEALAPDLIVVMSYGQIVPREILAAPRIACINLHASLLPRHRGAAPIQAAIEAGDRESGITVMYMNEGLDSGDILLERKVPIRRRETGGTLHDRLAELASIALAEALPLLEQAAAPRVPQDSTLATYAKKITREKGRIDWTAPAVDIERKIRAFNPWPTAFTVLRDVNDRPATLKIFSSILVRKKSGTAGTVLAADERGILVATGEGALLLREIQLEGKRRMPAADFLLGHRLATGAMLG
ncbi:MAG: methionyl-tRNA formyltransferase [Verrucomicrobiota bacterium]|nr:methionyl-tRNA formyltransferase [Verrucomicrobiota bacterium]